MYMYLSYLIFDTSTNYCNHLLSQVRLTLSDIELIMQTLIYDGKVEKNVVIERHKSQSNLYRATASFIKSSGLMHTPCGHCPVGFTSIKWLDKSTEYLLSLLLIHSRYELTAVQVMSYLLKNVYTCQHGWTFRIEMEFIIFNKHFWKCFIHVLVCKDLNI